MAGPYFWVGGSGNWSDSTNHWATISGGAPNVANVPTSADNVNFDSASNTTAYTVTVDATANCKDMTWALPSVSGVPTLASAGFTLNISGSMTLVSGMLWTASVLVSFGATTTGKTITSAGVTLGTSQVIFNGAGGGWTLQDALTMGNVALTVLAGTLNTNAKNVQAGSFVSTSGTRTLTLDNSTINIIGTSGSVWNINTSGALTFSATGSILNVNGGSANANVSVALGGALTYNTVNITAAGLIALNAISTPTVKNFSYTSTTNKTDTLSFNGPITIDASGSLTIAGNSTVNRAFVFSTTLGTQRTITVPNTATVTLTNVDFQDIASAGTFGTWTGTSLGDCLGNSGITFDGSTTQTYVGGASGNWSTAAKWTSRVPLPQDDVAIASGDAGSVLTADMPRWGRNINFTSFTRTFTMSVNATLFGNVTLASAMALTGNFTLNLSGRGSQTITSNTKQFSNNNVLVTAFGGTYTLQDDMSLANALVVQAGTFDAGAFGVTIATTFSTSGAQAGATIKGSGTWTFTNTGGNLWLATSVLTTTNFTATIKLTGNISVNAVFSGAGLTYGSLWWSSTTSTGSLTISGANTFTTLRIDCTTARTLELTSSTTNVITTWQQDNVTNGKLLTIKSSIGATAATLSKSSGTVNFNMVSIQDITATGGAAFAVKDANGVPSPNYLNVSGNTGITFTAFKYLGTLTANAANWSTANWYAKLDLSGGTVAVPTSADNVAFCYTANTIAYTLTVDTSSACLNMYWNLPLTSGVPTLTGGNGLTASGDVVFVTGMLHTMTNNFGMIGVGKTIRTNGVALGASFVPFNAASITLLDNLTCTTGGINVQNSAQLNTGGFTVTAKSHVVSSSGAQTYTNSTFNIGDTASSGTKWNYTGAGTLTATGSTINVNTGSVNSAYAFVGGSQTYGAIIFTAAGLWTVSGITSAATFSYTSTSDKRDQLILAGNLTVTGTCTIAGNSSVNRAFVLSSVLGTQRTITAGGLAVSNADFQDIKVLGTNSLTFPEAFDNAAWTKAKTTITANQVAAPDGTTTVDLFTCNLNGDANSSESLSVVSGSTYLLSVFAKPGTDNFAYLQLSLGGSFGFQYFNMSTGAVAGSSGTAGGFTLGTAFVAGPYTNGFYRLFVPVTVNATGTASFIVGMANANGGTALNGETAYFWGAMAHLGSRSLSYTSVGGTVVGSVDLSTITGLSGDALGNSNITFTTGTTQTYAGGTNNWSTLAAWTSRVPLPQDDVVVNTTTAGTLSADMPRLGRNINFTSFTRTFQGSASILSVFGNLTLASGMTESASPVFAYQLMGRGAQTLTTAGQQKTAGGVLTIAAFGGTYTLQDAINFNQSQLTLTNGTYNDGGFASTFTAFSGNNAAASGATLTISGTFSVNTTSGTPFNANSANLTVNATGSTIKLTGAVSGTINFQSTGKTFGNLWWSNTAATGTLIITGANTFNDFKVDGTTARTVQFPASTTQTMATLTASGTAGNLISLVSSTPGTAATISIPGGDVFRDYLRITDITATGGASFRAGTHSWNGSLIDLDFANSQYYGGTFAELITCARAAPATTYAETVAGTLTSFSANVARITDKGLLVEESRTNLCLQSQTLDNASWTKNSSTISANAVTAPDGTLTADKLIEASGTAEHKAYQLTGGAISSTYTWTIYAKAAERSWVYIDSAETSDNYTYFDLANGVVGTTGAGVTASISALANGWYRLQVKRTIGASAPYFQVGCTTGDGVASSVGDNTKGVYFWGAQLELGAFATSYIPTTTVAVTRSIDLITYIGPITTPLSAAAGSIFAKTNAINFVSGGRIVDANIQSPLRYASTTTVRSDIGAALTATLGSSDTTGTVLSALGWSSAGKSLVSNDGTSVTDVSGTNTNTTTFQATTLNGYLQRVAFWNTKIAAATLKTYTAAAPTFGLPSATGDTGWVFGNTSVTNSATMAAASQEIVAVAARNIKPSVSMLCAAVQSSTIRNSSAKSAAMAATAAETATTITSVAKSSAFVATATDAGSARTNVPYSVTFGAASSVSFSLLSFDAAIVALLSATATIVINEPLPTDSSRIVFTVAETRSVSVSGETRVVTVAGETRSVDSTMATRTVSSLD